MRKSVTKKVRFEVFKRDSFKCQYCGKSAPDVVLHVDHIVPVAKGGKNDVMNLVTSCFDCNMGKSDREISDQSVLARQRASLEELNERRQQIEMMAQWRHGLQSLKDDEVEVVVQALERVSPGRTITDIGRNDIRALLAKFPVDQVVAAIYEGAPTYIKIGDDGKATTESVGVLFHKLGGIARMAARPQHEKDLYYLRGILRKRVSMSQYSEHEAISLLKEAYELGFSIDQLRESVFAAWSYSGFARNLASVIEQAKKDRQQ